MKQWPQPLPPANRRCVSAPAPEQAGGGVQCRTGLWGAPDHAGRGAGPGSAADGLPRAGAGAQRREAASASGWHAPHPPDVAPHVFVPGAKAPGSP